MTILLDDDTAEMIAINAWSRGDNKKIMTWGAIHPEEREKYIVFAQSVARQLVALGWTAPDPTRPKGG